VPVKWEGFGASVGYSEDLVVMATYLFNAEKSVSTTTTAFGNTVSSGEAFPAKSAYLLELGYGFTVKNVRVGPMLSQFTYRYDKRVAAGVTSDLDGTYTDSYLLPQVALWMDF